MRIHISVSVDDIAKAIDYYSCMFAQPPTVVRQEYAKWMVDDPKLNFVVDKKCGSEGVDHLGIQAETEEELKTVNARIKKAGQPHTDVAAAHCCYAKSDKAWTLGVGREKWEVFFTHHQGESEYGPDIQTGL